MTAFELLAGWRLGGRERPVVVDGSRPGVTGREVRLVSGFRQTACQAISYTNMFWTGVKKEPTYGPKYLLIYA